MLSRASMGRFGFVAQMYIGGGLVGVGLVIALIGELNNIRGMEYGAVGPYIAGFTNLVVGGFCYSKFKVHPLKDIRLSTEARSFLGDLYRQVIGTGYEWYEQTQETHWDGSVKRHDLGRWRSKDYGSWFRAKTHPPQELLSPELFDLLERACFQYNRICGLVEAAPEASPIKRFTTAAQLSADEAMAQIAHQGSMVSRYPESAAAAVQSVETRIAGLAELADRLESLQSRQPTFVDRMGSSSSLDNLLDELKLEDLARAELQPLTRPETSPNSWTTPFQGSSSLDQTHQEDHLREGL